MSLRSAFSLTRSAALLLGGLCTALAAAAERIRDALDGAVRLRPGAKDDAGRDKADFPLFWTLMNAPKEKIPPAQMIAAFQQLLPIENRDLRLEVVYYLRKEQDKAAT